MTLNFFVFVYLYTGTTCYPHSKDNNNLVISSLSQVIHQVNVDPDIDKASSHKMVALNGHFYNRRTHLQDSQQQKNQMPSLGKK